MDKAGVDGVVVVPPSWEGDRNDLANDAAKSHPNRLRRRWAVSIPKRPVRQAELADWKKQPGMLGVRFTFHTEVLRQPRCSTAASTGCGASWRSTVSRRWCCSITSTCILRTRWPSVIPACAWCLIILD